MTDTIDQKERSTTDKQELVRRKKALRNSGKIFKFAAPITVMIIVIVVAIITFLYVSNISTNQEKLGTIGDFFGGLLDPFLAFISFIALLWTIKQQNDALLISADELECTRKELEESKEALNRSAQAQENSEKLQEQQSRMLQVQQFENSFYSLLEQHNQIYQLTNNSLNSLQIGNGIKAAKQTILEDSQLSMYMRMLYQLLKFIVINHPSNKASRFDGDYLLLEASDDERRYSSIVRSCIDNDMIKLIAINGYCELHNDDEFYEYFLMLERYRFLEHIEITTTNMRNGFYSLQYSNYSEYVTIREVAGTYNRAFGKHGRKRLATSLTDGCSNCYDEEVKGALKRYILRSANYKGRIFKDSYFYQWYRDIGGSLLGN